MDEKRMEKLLRKIERNIREATADHHKGEYRYFVGEFISGRRQAKDARTSKLVSKDVVIDYLEGRRR